MATNSEETCALGNEELKKIYYENFIDELNDEELMYKKTVEDLFYIYKSFGFIYSIIKKANLLLNKESFDMFLKSLVSFIDELVLSNPNIFDQDLSNLNINYINKEDNSFQNKKKRKIDSEDIYKVDNVSDNQAGKNDDNFGLSNSVENNNFMTLMSKRYIEELLKDISNISQEFSSTKCEDFLFIINNILKMKNNIVVDHAKNRIDKIKNTLNIGKHIFTQEENIDISNSTNGGDEKTVRIYDYIDEMIKKLEQIEPTITSIIFKQNFWHKQIMNKSEYDSLNSVLNLDIDTLNEKTEETYDEVINLLGDKMTNNKDILAAKNKLERIKISYDAEIQRKQQQEMEMLKKLEDKRKAVQFIIDRYDEYTWFDKNSPKKHSFYILGINPRNITEDQLKYFGKRLKHILHPDKEPNPEWKQKAESAFKEASLAILGCQKEFKTKILKTLEPGPPAPYLSLIGIENTSQTPESPKTSQQNLPSSSTTSPNTSLPQYYPTHAYYPKFDLKCVDQKIGTILIDIKCPVQLGVIKKVIVYAHRPIYGAEPISLIPEDIYISHKNEMDVNIKNFNQNIEARIDYVQPLEIAASTKYYIGIQLIAERGNTMINWNSIHITLHKFSNKNIIKKLLSSFKNASFINQAQLNVTLSNENKDEMTTFLNECITKAKAWAQTV
ncbi:conserved Plasmodium protein, unknown function [Plasmodium vinckei lentum]|uniref:DnaJ protein n=1 Tax=Plasmodium vinckei lentum TaxID=138297 RepID=A0A6V7S485_PLAVN|nr:conserved Plasmodium protein, unknown function [Plasmodium vinckei lentum]